MLFRSLRLAFRMTGENLRMSTYRTFATSREPHFLDHQHDKSLGVAGDNLSCGAPDHFMVELRLRQTYGWLRMVRNLIILSFNYNYAIVSQIDVNIFV